MMQSSSAALAFTADQEPSGLTAAVLGYLRNHHGNAWSLLIDGAHRSRDEVALQDLNDLIYSLHFLDWPVQPGPSGRIVLADYLRSVSLAAGLNGSPADETVSVHGTAYTIGALTLLRGQGQDLFQEVMTPSDWRWGDLIDARTLKPRWPAAWSHHNWRVSHWVGGSLAILCELSRHMPDACQVSGAPPLEEVLTATDDLIDPRTGLLKCYRSDLLQFAFRQAYRLRHDPLLGDIGGIVHVHWVNYACGRQFKAGDRLFQRAQAAMLGRRPFMEGVPYCLDFDVVQIVRTAMPADLGGRARDAVVERARAYATDVASYLANHLGPDYGLHKLPGALATIHECALIDPALSLDHLGLHMQDGRPKDIMRDTSWL